MCPREHMGEFPTTFDSTLNPAYGKISTITLTHSCTGQRRIQPISMNVGRGMEPEYAAISDPDHQFKPEGRITRV